MINITPSEQLSPLPQETFESLHIGFVHRPDSVSLVELSSFPVVGALLLLDEFATPGIRNRSPVNKLYFYQIPHIKELIAEGVKEISQERPHERIEE